MRKELSKIIQDLEQGAITDIEARTILLGLLIVSESMLATQGLTIKYEDYGMWKLRQNGEYLMEGEKLECHQRAFEILKKYSS
jgi:hypothetical protein